MKKIISIFLALVLICSVFCVTAFAGGRIGDANGDSNLSAVDARMILQHVAGIKTIEDTSNLDINNDKKVSAVDARVILQIVAGIIEDPMKEEQLKIFVDSFNNVKTNAKSATLSSTQIYNYDNYFKADAAFESLYKFATDGGDIKEDFLGGLNEATSNSQTFFDEDVAKNFPPLGGVCNLKLSDVSDFRFDETDGYYTISFKVSGKKNPSRYESVGNVASIITKEDLEKELSNEESFKGISINCDYKYALVKATIEKSTGNMLEYSVDTAMVVSVNMATVPPMGLECGIGSLETWEKIKY